MGRIGPIGFQWLLSNTYSHKSFGYTHVHKVAIGPCYRPIARDHEKALFGSADRKCMSDDVMGPSGYLWARG
jgi:hypothetical protein